MNKDEYSTFLNLPIRPRTIIHEPMLERIEIRRYLATGLIQQVTMELKKMLGMTRYSEDAAYIGIVMTMLME